MQEGHACKGLRDTRLDNTEEDLAGAVCSH